MDIGIMTRTVDRPTLREVLDALAQHGLRHVQFGFQSAGLLPMPDEIDEGTLDAIRDAFAARGMTISALSGTFNMIDPDRAKRREGLRQLRTIMNACDRLGTRIITLCTGTRDPDYLWRRHPDNDTPGAWRDMVESVGQAVRDAEETGVTLAFEPEVSNVVDSARKGRRLLDEIRSDHLKVVIDGANLFHAGELPRMREILDEGFDLLGADIVLAHAKDLSRDGEAGHDAAGTGKLDYAHYLALLQRSGYAGPLILHSLTEAQIAGCMAFLHAWMPG